MSIDPKFQENVEKIKQFYETEIQNALQTKIELTLLPKTQFIYKAIFPIGKDLIIGYFPITAFDFKSAGATLGSKIVPLPRAITLGTAIESSISTSIITKTIQTGFRSSSRVFLPLLPEMVASRFSQGATKISDLMKQGNEVAKHRGDTFIMNPNSDYKTRRNFDKNPLVERLNSDASLMNYVQTIPVETTKSTGGLSSSYIKFNINDNRDDTNTLIQITPYNKKTYAILQFMPNLAETVFNKNKLGKIDIMLEIIKKISHHIRNDTIANEQNGFITQKWVESFIALWETESIPPPPPN